MTLAAAQVVDTLAARLVPVALSGGRVFTSRLWPLSEAELPCWKVIADSEDVQVALVDGMNQHDLTVSAEGYVRATDNVDDSMHALAEQGLTALFALPAPYELQLISIERETTNESEAALGLIRLRMTTRYYVRPEAPQTIYT